MSKSIDKTMVTVGDRPENNAIIEFCERKEISHSQGPEDDLLKRHLNSIEQTDCDILCRVTGDCPFVPPSEVNRIVREHKRNNAHYTTNVTNEMPIGTAVDVIDRDMLKKLHDIGDTHPVRRPRNNPKEWNTIVTPNEQWKAYSDTHTAVDTPQDYWALSDAIAAVGDDPLSVTKWIAEQ
jgi:spore coat polysaccharide biosynthesis protein SpsF